MKAKSGKQKRFKSFDHTDPDVVTVGMDHFILQSCHQFTPTI